MTAAIAAKNTVTPPAGSLRFDNGLVSPYRDTGNGHHLVLKRYATGDLDLVAVRLGPDQSLQRGGGAKRERSTKEEMTPEVLAKSRARARRTVRQKGLMMKPDRILTLTYRKNVTSLAEAWKDFGKFTRKMRWRFGERWKYICVPEFQKRGAVHFHCAIEGYYPVEIVRTFWWEIVGMGQGNIDITSPKRRNGNASRSPKKVIQYITKYITKSDAAEFNGKRYSASTNIEPPEIAVGWLAVGPRVPQLLERIMREISHRPVTVRWETDEGIELHFYSTA